MAKAHVQPTADIDPANKRRARRIFKKLEQLYPDATCALTHTNPFQLLIATILSAQCSDEQVNKVTPALFEAFPTPDAMADATLPRIEKHIRTLGLFRNKAKSLKGAATMIVEQFDGKVPDNMADLLELPGVARKTANVVLGNAFDTNVGVVVDTHVGRLSRRLGFTEHEDAGKVERDLMALFARTHWALLSHLLIFHGRRVCTARGPKCDECALKRSCPQIGVETQPKKTGK